MITRNKEADLAGLRIILAAAVALGAFSASAQEVVFEDPIGDDNGLGKYVYPTDPVYKPGLYWLLDAKEFDNGRVNYIIHKGDKKEQCNKDIFWLIKDSREPWVNAGDCKSYPTKDAAPKARKWIVSTDRGAAGRRRPFSLLHAHWPSPRGEGAACHREPR